MTRAEIVRGYAQLERHRDRLESAAERARWRKVQHRLLGAGLVEERVYDDERRLVATRRFVLGAATPTARLTARQPTGRRVA